MSKIGKKKILIPKEVNLSINGDSLDIKGPFGSKKINLDTKLFEVNVSKNNELSIKPIRKIDDNGAKKQNILINLKYHYGNPVINSIERISKPGRRIYSSAESVPKINNGLGIAILSTPKGVMSDMDARKQKVGGEIICKVF